ncbi:hypothetical protein BU24DRAFT_249618 [Aaosphaeria arxii CBS 175.79]|uniref:ATP-dependent DNA helicase n=1 Tax=Aaosphaeria arxii CBS 175.79 TaxID=1450172 RepID=A0A6A5XL90_9PLEO|nr:uncharacterized protein BU24DRAFT_249618 [Aaosphaeria arxii CBS 175.79]KAF2013912.1 hypothetical protein BU24DRAFT_249618 [Aaosphaeria arxii CBS 175.79]
MTITHTRIAQTSKEAQKEYKKKSHGTYIPQGQMRQLERGVVLDERAAKYREQERRKRLAKQKREEKERKEQAIRKQLGVGLATQLIGYSHTQARMKSGMEAFLGFRKKKEEEEKEKERETNKQLEDLAEELDKEPWDNEDEVGAVVDLAIGTPEKPKANPEVQLFDEVGMVLDLATVPPELPKANAEDQLFDEDLDDDALLEAHDTFVSDSPEKAREIPPIPTPTPVRVSAPTKNIISPQKQSPIKEGVDFTRLHGPINKVIENSLAALPEPLIELLSVDTSMNTPKWEPSASLLHKLNPLGLPPHRLRIKIGCTLTVLRDLNCSSQISKSSHLRVLRLHNERLECLVLDGQLEGTKTILTRFPFTANYRNDEQCPFRRMQYPVRVATDFHYPGAVQSDKEPRFKQPLKSAPPTNPIRSFKKPPISATAIKPNMNPNPIFKRPNLPASKTRAATPVLKPTEQASVPIDLDIFDFLDSATQISRDLSSDDTPSSPSKPFSNRFDLKAPAVQEPVRECSFDMDDLDFSTDDLEDILEPKTSPKSIDGHQPPRQIGTTVAAPGQPPPSSTRPMKSPGQTGAPNKTQTPRMAPPPLNSKRKADSPLAQPPPKRLPARPPSHMGSERPFICSVTKPEPTMARGSSDTCLSFSKPTYQPPPPQSYPSFSEFGLSTQEAVSFFDDDEFSSPTISV